MTTWVPIIFELLHQYSSTVKIIVQYKFRISRHFLFFSFLGSTTNFSFIYRVIYLAIATLSLPSIYLCIYITCMDIIPAKEIPAGGLESFCGKQYRCRSDYSLFVYARHTKYHNSRFPRKNSPGVEHSKERE